MLARIMPFNSHVSENVIAWILFLPIRRGSYVPGSVSFLPYSVFLSVMVCLLSFDVILFRFDSQRLNCKCIVIPLVVGRRLARERNRLLSVGSTIACKYVQLFFRRWTNV